MIPTSFKNLIDTVYANENRNVPYIRWIDDSPKFFSHGWGGDFKITVFQGTFDLDTKVIVLHEIAHNLVGARQRHNDVFWNKACLLYRLYNIPFDYLVWREIGYKARAVKWLEHHYGMKIDKEVVKQIRESRKTGRGLMENYPHHLYPAPVIKRYGRKSLWVDSLLGT